MKKSSILLAFAALIGIISCSTDIHHMQLLETYHMEFSEGYHFIDIPAFENDTMAFQVEAKYTKNTPIVNDFTIYIRGFNIQPTEPEILDLSNYQSQLIKYETTEYSDSVVFSYPFETIENVQYLGFYFHTYRDYDLYIYIKSEKAEAAALGAGIIVLIVVLCLAVCGGAGTFLLRKFGCWVRVHSSSI